MTQRHRGRQSSDGTLLYWRALAARRGADHVLIWPSTGFLHSLVRDLTRGSYLNVRQGQGRQTGMKIQHPILYGRSGQPGPPWCWQLGRTLKYHFRYKDPVVDPEVARTTGQRYIYAFFHEVTLFPAYYWNWPEMHILISEHRDGELITQVVKRLGFSVVRGSTTRGGARALREMSLRIDQGHLCVTPDGPRGPRRSVHQGVAYLASRTGLPIVGAGMAFKKPWRAKSWDRFCVPRPFQSGRLRRSGGRHRAPQMPTATRSRRAARKSSDACRQPRSKPKPGSRAMKNGRSRFTGSHRANEHHVRTGSDFSI